MSSRAPNRAVMEARRAGNADLLNFYPTPPFATRALCEFLEGEIGPLASLSAWEPAAGEGHMARPLAECFRQVRESDVLAYRPGLEILDFPLLGALEPPCDLIITNPPFTLAQEFIEVGLKVARIGVAMLVRTSFLEGEGRYADLFAKAPLSFVLQFCERVVMLEGRLVRKGSIDPASEEGRRASTATSYCWLIWIRGRDDCRLRWIPPSLNRLERIGDYPRASVESLPPPADGLFGDPRL